MTNDKFYKKFHNQNGNDIRAVKRFQVIFKNEVIVLKYLMLTRCKFNVQSNTSIP